MKRSHFFVFVAFVLSIIFTACSRREDVGPYQEGTQSYSFGGFTQIKMGSAFKINVQQGTTFSITARGNVRNLNDLYVRVEGNVLKADYQPSNRSRQYTTEFIITMPTLEGIDFSGATISSISGFTSANLAYLRLSGASTSTISMQASELNVYLSGASVLNLSGGSPKTMAEISGASTFNAFNFVIEDALIKVSGASQAKVNVSKTLQAEASGASQIRYIGNPIVSSTISGASSVVKE